MKAFHHPDQALHNPRFFLIRGAVRPNYEIVERAAALHRGLSSLGIAPSEARPATVDQLTTVHRSDYLDFLARAAAAWAVLPGAGPEVVANTHPAPEMLANGAQAGTHVVHG